MISWKKIHEFMVKALEEPLLRAELHRVEISLPDTGEPQLQLIEGGNKKKENKASVEMKRMERFVARS